jgi:hypothetical protein
MFMKIKKHSNQQQKMPAKERKHEMFLLAAGTRHMRNCRNISNPERTQMKFRRPCPVSKYYYIQNCPAILKLSHICIALHLGGGNQLISLIWSWWSNASSPYETILRKNIHIYVCRWWRKHYKCKIHRKMYVWYRECHHTSLNITS